MKIPRMQRASTERRVHEVDGVFVKMLGFATADSAIFGLERESKSLYREREIMLMSFDLLFSGCYTEDLLKVVLATGK